MDYVGRIIRPPGEAGSILLQVTQGCSHNRCAFCGAYKDKPFALKPDSRILADIQAAALLYPDERRLFLCDGDVLALPMHRLSRLLDDIRRVLPRVARVTSYASARNLRSKSVDDLAALKERGLSTLYLGLESGDPATLAAVRKGSTVDEMVRAAEKIRAAGLKLNVTVLLGLAGRERSLTHARATGEVLTAMQPHQAAALTLMLIPGTPLDLEAQAGRFVLPDARGMLLELRTLLEQTHLDSGLFMADHASNYLPLKGRLPKDKPRLLAELDRALHGKTALTPESCRRL